MSRRLTVVGSYAVGLTMRTQRIPVPGETLLADEFDHGPGGKGSNQAIQAARLGANVTLVAAVGNDQFGDAALALWRAEGVDCSMVSRAPGMPTGSGFILLDADGENRIILYPGANAALDERRVVALADRLADSAVVLAQLEIAPGAAAAAMRVGRAAGALTILDPAPAHPLDDAVLSDVDLLVPNETEARIMLGVAPLAAAADEALCRELLARGVGTVVMTLGARGALIADEHGIAHVEADAVDVVDTTGAGDAFAGAVAAALAEGRPRDAAVRRAVCAGSLACTRLGVVSSLPTREQLSQHDRVTHDS